VNALAQGTLRPFTQELWVEHPTFQLRGRHSVTELFALWYLQVAFNLSNKTLNILTMKNFSISKQVLTKQCDYILALYYFGAGGGGKTIVTCCCAILWGGWQNDCDLLYRPAGHVFENFKGCYCQVVPHGCGPVSIAALKVVDACKNEVQSFVYLEYVVLNISFWLTHVSTFACRRRSPVRYNDYRRR